MTEQSIKIYIVEPDPLFIKVLERTLMEISDVLQANIFCFTDGEAFLNRYTHRDEYAIYIINDTLPKQSGTTVISEIRKHDEKGIIYIMSKSNTSRALEFAIGLGADNFFIKPFNLDVFKAVITRKLERRLFAWN